MWAAIRTVKEKVGTWVGYARATEAGLDIDRADWARWIGQAQNSIANRLTELARPLTRRPTGSDILPMDTVRQTGFLQSTVIYVKDRDTGVIRDQWFTVRSKTLHSRRSVVARAIREYQGAIDANPDEYPEEIVGASYWSTHEMIPRG